MLSWGTAADENGVPVWREDMRGRKLDSLGVSAFCESMAMMVQSGIQMDEAVSQD